MGYRRVVGQIDSHVYSIQGLENVISRLYTNRAMVGYKRTLTQPRTSLGVTRAPEREPLSHNQDSNPNALLYCNT